MRARWHRFRRWVSRLFLLAAVPACLLLGWIGLGLRHSGDSADCIFVPGAAIWRNRQPSDALEYRLAHALDLYRQKRAPVIVVAGGGKGNYAEAEVMTEWLIEHGVPPEAIIKETASNTTRENAENAAPLMHRRGLSSALVCTQWFHVTRASLCLDQQGIATKPAPCGGKLLLREPWFVAREMAALTAYALKIDQWR